MELNTIMCGNCADIMKQMPDECIDLTVTSPPYDNLRTYKGYSFDFEVVAKQLYRITSPGGVLVWIVGDATIKGSETGTSFRQALYFMDCGFNLHDTMIYAKENWIPLTHKRYEQQFEYMFVFSKGIPKYFSPLTIPSIHGGRKISRKSQHENHAVRGRESSMITAKEKRKPNIWFYKVGTNCSTKDAVAFVHPAIFPEQLAADHILSWSNQGDIVFDPMCGSGTTLKMAKQLGRNYIGIDISEEYCEIAKKRVE